MNWRIFWAYWKKYRIFAPFVLIFAACWMMSWAGYPPEMRPKWTDFLNENHS